MADRYQDPTRQPDDVRDDMRSSLGEEEAERRRQMDERERGFTRGRRKQSGHHQQEWGDYPYRGET